MKNKLTIVFDFDGTIVQSQLLIEGIVKSLQHKYKLAEINTVEIDVRKLTAKELLKAIKIKKWKIPFFIYEVKKLMRVDINSLSIEPGLEEVIRQLHTLNFRLIIMSSNSKKNIKSYLQKHKLEHYFEDIITSSKLFKKEVPLKKIKKRYSNCVYIGDEVRDIVACKLANMNNIAVEWGFNDAQILKKENPNYLIKEPKELIPLLTSISVDKMD
ncbi:HAD-IA family hydrolase [Flammeovirga yaeyamensis]|uniref:HAD-IA family hydrolase n=1 Tax=Flammeovirga yaeyamensis TaxID=367791 RepID=A0AAX1N8L6_9BACT|nr:HAD-IA family hydrolase [Flammeovirga yaeyamensis]MBB3698725.1 phosphoglycolate phosphatase-like HAD superfamily hydrolase [Flammeovirga yaeyamensis]NMF37311.1 HAD-IA family hydrolase [Flammeovirga yaeyamensis]QWG03871.1 HAD-IA family hydrolase [Flammeovirga yaeyamensis]